MAHAAHGTAAAGTSAGATAPSLLSIIDAVPDNGGEDYRYQTGNDTCGQIHFHYPPLFLCCYRFAAYRILIILIRPEQHIEHECQNQRCCQSPDDAAGAGKPGTELIHHQ